MGVNGLQKNWGIVKYAVSQVRSGSLMIRHDMDILKGRSQAWAVVHHLVEHIVPRIWIEIFS